MSGAAAVYVGLDCGGSTSRSLAIDAAGGPVFHGQSGAANLATTPDKLLRRHLARATEGCPEPTAICGCFAGLMNAADRRRAEDLLSDLFPAARVRAEPDYAAAYAAADTPIDVCVIAGTGSLVCSASNGGWVKTGGGGYLLGDSGSAFDLGRSALRHFMFGGEPASLRLAGLVEETFGTTVTSDVVAQLYAHPSPVALLAKLAPAIAKDAEAGLPYATIALAAGMNELARLTVQHLQRHFPGTGTVRIGLAGGIWKTSATVLTVFTSSIRDQLDRSFDVERLRRPPVYGATALAKELTLGN